ncbi:hypothetical protein [Pasteuria penetrans]|uniref:hypothetical protein n=1 Tax=Pasteuria penetrans TaxID=86005 RepID=UPI000FA11DC8|nr:hypothetical protein [Pasteuria penetrans]
MLSRTWSVKLLLGVGVCSLTLVPSFSHAESIRVSAEEKMETAPDPILQGEDFREVASIFEKIGRGFEKCLGSSEDTNGDTRDLADILGKMDENALSCLKEQGGSYNEGDLRKVFQTLGRAVMGTVDYLDMESSVVQGASIHKKLQKFNEYLQGRGMKIGENSGDIKDIRLTLKKNAPEFMKKEEGGMGSGPLIIRVYPIYKDGELVGSISDPLNPTREGLQTQANILVNGKASSYSIGRNGTIVPIILDGEFKIPPFTGLNLPSPDELQGENALWDQVVEASPLGQ